MKVYDSVNKTEVEVDGTQGLIDIMVSGRQVDIYLKGALTSRDLSAAILTKERF